MDSSQTLSAFAQKAHRRGLVPEPYATRLILDSGAHVLSTSGPSGRTGSSRSPLLAVRTDFLQSTRTRSAPSSRQASTPAGHQHDSGEGQQDVADVIATVSGKPIKADVLAASWKNLDFTSDPVASRSSPVPSTPSRWASSDQAGARRARRPVHPQRGHRPWPAGGGVMTALTLQAPAPEQTVAPAVRLSGDEALRRRARLDGIDLDVQPGSSSVSSGSGWEVHLLNLVSRLDKPSTRTVEVAGRATLMFQEAALFPWLSALDNVAMPMRLAGVEQSTRESAYRPARRRAPA